MPGTNKMSVWIGYLDYFDEIVEMTFHSVILNEGLFIAQGSSRYGNFTYEGTIINKVFQAKKHSNTWDMYQEPIMGILRFKR